MLRSGFREPQARGDLRRRPGTQITKTALTVSEKIPNPPPSLARKSLFACHLKASRQVKILMFPASPGARANHDNIHPDLIRSPVHPWAKTMITSTQIASVRQGIRRATVITSTRTSLISTTQRSHPDLIRSLDPWANHDNVHAKHP